MPERSEPQRGGSRRPNSTLWLPLVALIVGLAVTAALALVSAHQYRANEKRLLELRVRDAATLFTAALPSIETPLASAATLAEATHGNASEFQQFAAPYVHGPAPEFVSMSLWKLSAAHSGPVAVVGAAPKLEAVPGRVARVLERAMRSRTLTVAGLLSGSSSPRLGYAFVTPGGTRGYVAYAESALPANRRSRLQSNSAFAGLDYAMYLGTARQARNLLVTDRRRLPLPHPSYAESVKFGDSALTLAMSSRGSLAGSLPRELPWIIVIVGVLLSCAAAALTWRLAARRRVAEELAGRLERSEHETRRLYDEQRGIAQTLQHALLPQELPQAPGIVAAGQYRAGEEGVEVGGDWYDLIDLGEGRLLLVVGDVSGRGLRAAHTMAALRFAIRAYATQGDAPTEILAKLSALLDVRVDGQIATVLCATIDADSRQISITSAGHLPALLIADGSARFLEAHPGPPIGVQDGAPYTAETLLAPAGATLIAYTDGLVEVRGEHLEQGLERLRVAALRDRHEELSDLLCKLTTEIATQASHDDIALVGVRWIRQNLSPSN